MVLNFLLKALVSLVNLLMCIRIVKFWRSTNDVLICAGSGLPDTTHFSYIGYKVYVYIQFDNDEKNYITSIDGYNHTML
jgi:hypothetical protein